MRHLGPTFEEWTSRHIPNSNFLDPYTTLGPSLQPSTSLPEYNEEHSSNVPVYRDEFSTNAPDYHDEFSSNVPEYRQEFSSNSPDWYSTTAPTSIPDADFRINSASPYYEQGGAELPSARQTRTRFPSFFSDSPFHTAGSTFYSSWPDPDAAFLAQYSTTTEPVRLTEDTLDYTNTPDYASTSPRRPVSEPTTPQLNLLSSSLSVDVKDTAAVDYTSTTPNSQYSITSSSGLDIPKNWILIAKDPEMLKSFLKSTEYSTSQAPTSQEPTTTASYTPTETTVPTTSPTSTYDPTPDIVTASPSKVDDLQQLAASREQGYSAGSFQPSVEVSDQSFLPYSPTGNPGPVQNNQPAQSYSSPTGQTFTDFTPSNPIPSYAGSKPVQTSNIRTPVRTYIAPVNPTPNTPQFGKITHGVPLRQGYSTPAQTYGAPTQTYGAPTQTYGAPTQTYGAPTQTYGAPIKTSYGAPTQTYGAPTQTYGAPSQTYGAPAQTYGAPIKTSYGVPTQTYGPPTQTYGAPIKASYGAPTTSYGAPKPTKGYGAPVPTQGYGAPKPTKGYGAPKPTKGYGLPKLKKGFGAPKPTKGYGAPKPTKGYGIPKLTKGYGAPKPTKGYGAPKPTKGYGAPKLTKGYGTPTPSYNVPNPAPTYYRPQDPVEHFRINPVSQGAPIKLQLVSTASPHVHAILGTNQPLPVSTQKPIWNQPYKEPVQQLPAQPFNYGSTTRFDYDIGPTTSAPSEPFRSAEAVSFTSDSIPFRPSNLMTVSSASPDLPLPGEYRQSRSQKSPEVVREYPVPRSDSVPVDHMSFVVQPTFPYSS